jgi:uncharacterized protein YbjT (DUF2867 family)
VEVVAGDAGDPEALGRALSGCGAVYYLLHSMLAAGPAYRDHDRRLAELLARSAGEQGLDRIIYLGGLGETGEGLSEHLSSRREVEHALASGPVPVTVLRAAMIIGSGSASFEILRYLVERLPIMITPKWVSTESQPIAIDNVLTYLVDCLRVRETVGRTLDIGGPDVVSYRDLMDVMARARGLRPRVIVPVPVLSPRLSSLWLHLVTPVDHRIARPLAEGLRNRVVCRGGEAARLMPQRLLGVREAIELALEQVQVGNVETTWSAAAAMPGDPDWAGGKVFVDTRVLPVAAPADAVFRSGWLDRLVGGPGLRRGRRDPERVAYGEALDFWRVTDIEAGKRLRLRAEMRLPGDAQLSFELEPLPGDRTRLVQTARFKPKGLLGILYWYAVLPLHGFVFQGMIRGIRDHAESKETPSRSATRPSSGPGS